LNEISKSVVSERHIELTIRKTALCANIVDA
jgi:hypothetical protein